MSGGMAHLASCFSCVDIIYTLYCKGVLRHDPNDPSRPGLDHFILSKGHGGLALYTVLKRCGYLSAKQLESYLQPGCQIGGEPNVRDLPGIEASTGALGHGLSVGVGKALAQKINSENGRTFVLLGDGEIQEGSVWEAAMSATAFSLGNLIAVLDFNRLQKSKTVREMIRLENWTEKWIAFGWHVSEVDGHDPDAIKDCLTSIILDNQPQMVIAHTVKGKGVSLMENNPIWHFKLPNRKERRIFEQELKIWEMGVQADA
jgi:transketolase